MFAVFQNKTLTIFVSTGGTSLPQYFRVMGGNHANVQG